MSIVDKIIDKIFEIFFLSFIYYCFFFIYLLTLQTLTDLDDHIQAQETLGNSTGNSIVASGMAQLFCSLIPEEPFEKSTLQSRVQDIAG